MPTKKSLIDRAFSNIGIASYTFDISPDEYQDALTRLDDMMAEWDGIGIRLGYVLPANEVPSDPADESGVADYTITAISSNLAIRIAPMFGKTVSPDVYKMAAKGYDNMLISTFSPVPMKYPNTMPLGQGYKSRYLYNRFYHDNDVDAIKLENDGNLE